MTGIPGAARLALLLAAAGDPCARADSVATASPARLRPGESVERTVDARCRRNRTGVTLDSGGVYTLTARGAWLDQTIRSGPGGYRLRDAPWYGRPFLFVGAPLRRAPRVRYFALVGELRTRPRRFFTIGDSLPAWTAPAAGELVAFANDVSFKYGNNHESVTLVVRRLR